MHMIASFPWCSGNSHDWRFPCSVRRTMGTRVGLGFATMHWNDLGSTKSHSFFISVCARCAWVCANMFICMWIYRCSKNCRKGHKDDNQGISSSMALPCILWGRASLSSWNLLISQLASLLPVFVFWGCNYRQIGTHARQVYGFWGSKLRWSLWTSSTLIAELSPQPHICSLNW